MSALTPPDYCKPIPNGPFYSPPSWQICGSYLNYTVGYGICISPEGDMESWNCGVGVSGLVAGAGIQVTPITPDVWEVSNSGIIAINPGEGIVSTGGQNPTFSLADNGVNPGIYSYPSIETNEYGQICSAASRPPTIRCDVIQAKGNLIAGLVTQVGTALPVGANGRVLSPDTSCALGMRWALPSEIPYVLCCCLPSKGYLAVGSSTPNTPVALAPTTGSRVLITCSACPEGMYWGNCAFADNVQNYTNTVSQTNGTDCCWLVTPDFMSCGCSAYRIMLAASACSVDSYPAFGLVRFLVGTAPVPAFTCFTTRISPLGVEEPAPIALTWIQLNPSFATGRSLSLEIYVNTNAIVLPVTVSTRYNISIFGF